MDEPRKPLIHRAVGAIPIAGLAAIPLVAELIEELWVSPTLALFVLRSRLRHEGALSVLRSLVSGGHRPGGGRPRAALHAVATDERRPALGLVIEDDQSDEQPAAVEAAPAPVLLLPVEPHRPGGYDLRARCCWCGTVLAPGSDLADCAACRAMPGGAR